MTQQQDILHSSNQPRRRNISNQPNVSYQNPVPPQQKKKKLSPSPFTSPTSSFSSLITLILAFSASIVLISAVQLWGRYKAHSLNSLHPTPEKPFNFDNAMHHIRTIASEPRWVGSGALELSFQYLLTEIAALQLIASRNGLHVELEMFRSGPGSYSVDLAHIDLIISYHNVSNVVARLSPAHMSTDMSTKSLMLAAHVDSTPSSPGANDNVVGVAVLLEVLRCVVESDLYSLRRPIIFFFNGGEEAILTGAHAFITQHRWASTVAAHINMESIGAGDMYHLFRLGPHNSWLVEAYAKSVSMPSTSVTATDLFNLKIIPAETDFRVFSEFGDIPGFDFVLLDNGYIYHTKYDSIDSVVPSGVRHGGQTIFELTMELAGPNDAIGKHEARRATTTVSERFYAALVRLANDLGLVKDPDRPLTVFFDVLLLKTIVYEEGVAVLLNIFVLLCTLLIWLAKFEAMGMKGFKSSLYMCAVLLGCIVGAFASSTFASLVYAEAFGTKLRWYGSWLNAFLIYAPSAIFGTVSALLLLLPRQLPLSRFDHMLFAYTIFIGTLTILLMVYHCMCSYMTILFLIAANICAVQGERVHPVLRHFQLAAVNAVFGARTISTSLSAMLPLLGRIRSDKIPHDTLAAILVTHWTTVSLLLPSLPLFCYLANSLRKFQGIIFFLSFGVATWFVFAVTITGRNLQQITYSKDAPKRYVAIHFHSPQHDPESVLFLGSMDPIPLDTTRIMSQVFNETTASHSRYKLLTWGKLESTPLECFRPLSAFITDIALFQTEAPPSLPLPKVSVVSEVEGSKHWNVTLSVEGPDADQLTARFPVGGNTSVLEWSLEVDQKDIAGGAWIRHVGSDSFKFWVTLNKTEGLKRPKFRMAVTNCRLGYSRSRDIIAKLNFEEWEAPEAAASSGIEVEV